jgi:hypothetical protein
MVDEFVESNIEKFKALIALHERFKALNPALEKCYPVAVVEDDQFLIFDLDPDGEDYQFIKRTPTPMPVPTGVRAAFQLEDYGGRIVSVVTPEVFDSLGGYVTLLHEFVHCFQYEICEQSIKMGLDIARQAQESGDFMWEIEHPFPYTAHAFSIPYTEYLAGLENEDQQQVITARKALKTYLGMHDYEYMVWQEWKEGFARWVENTVRLALALPENKGGMEPPFSRVTFYAGGEARIKSLGKTQPELLSDLPKLFKRMYAI